MNNRLRCRFILFVCIFLFCITGLVAQTGFAQTGFAQTGFARGNQEKEPAMSEAEIELIQVTGRVRLVGSSPFGQIVITGEEKEWYLSREDAGKLHNLQHRTVTVEGEEIIRELNFANGRPAGKIRELRNITIISIQEASPF